MILGALVNYYEALAAKDEIQKLGYSKAKVSYALNLSAEGEIKQLIPLKIEVEKGKKMVERPVELLVPEQAPRSVGISVNVLCDHSGYILGADLKGKPKRSMECFEASKKRTLELLKNCNGQVAMGVKRYFMNWNPESVSDHPALADSLQDILAGENLVFWVEGKPALKDCEIINAWESQLGQENGVQNMRCLVTGETSPVTVLHPKIKGVMGAQSAGANLVSFNGSAYESYDRKQGFVAPVGEYASFAYGAALNHLLSSRKNRQTVGDMTVVFWSETAEEEYAELFSTKLNEEGDIDERLRVMVEKLSKGQPIDHVDMDSKFYVLGLSPNAARLSVRFFMEDSFGKILSNVLRHQERLEIIRAKYEKHDISLYQLLRETVNLNSKDKTPSPIMAGSMLRAILMGTAYPHAFYSGLLMRAKAERDINGKRAAGIKAFLLNSGDKSIDKEVLTVKVNETTKNKAYVLGRLFAVLERAQEEANPGINSTIKDRYFSSACASPGIVFPRLLRLSAFHNSKSDYGTYRDAEIGKLMCMLDADERPFPSHQSLQEQGMFMLGYYQQREQRYEKKEKVDYIQPTELENIQ